MKRIMFVLTVAVLLAVFGGGALAQTAPQETLDANTLSMPQSSTAYGFFPGTYQAQTFTAMHNGDVTRAQVKIHVDSAFPSVDGVKASITTVDAATGYPITSNVLASTTVPSSDIPLRDTNVDPSSIPLTTLTFENPARVEAGKQYAILLHGIAPPDTPMYVVRWTTVLGDYAGGRGMWVDDSGRFAGYLPGAQAQVFAIYITTPDTTPPSVTSTIPKANATEVAPTANVRATFSEEMDSTTIDETTFQLFKKGTTIQIPATVSYNADTNTAKLDPTNNLRRGVAYKAVVTTEAKDVEGNRLDQDGSTSGLQQMRWFFRVDD